MKLSAGCKFSALGIWSVALSMVLVLNNTKQIAFGIFEDNKIRARLVSHG